MLATRDLLGLSCGEVGEAGFCWRFASSAEAAPEGVLFLLAMQRPTPEATVAHLVVPLADGGLRHFVDRPQYEQFTASRLVRTLVQEHGRVAAVAWARLKVRVAYEEAQRLVATRTLLSARFGADGGLLEPYRPVGAGAFPPLPEAPRLAAAGAFEPDLATTEAFGTVAFEEAERDPDGALWVSAGELHEARDGAGFALRAPGFYLDLRTRSEPPLSLTLGTLAPREGPPRLLFADVCTGVSREEVRTSIRRKRDRGLFRRRLRVVELREELRVSSLCCRSLYDGELGEGP